MVHILDLKFQNAPHTIAAFLVETEDGPVLIETGPYSTFPVLEKEVAKLGFKIEDIKHVFLTHIHFDHAGAAWALAKTGAKIYVHPAGVKHLADPTKLYNSAKRIYGDKMEVLWGEMNTIPESQIIPVDNKTKIKVGKTKFKAWHTPGHATHHIAWQLDNELFTGDVGGVRIDGGIPLPPCPPPDINLPEWMDSIRLILDKRFDRLYLTHFGPVEDVREHLVELRGRLKNWANWIRPLLENKLSQEEIIPKFSNYVHEQLEAAGVSKETIAHYESANPAWMSVAGLTRYWVKVEGLDYQG
ncbi:MAG: MBL fold metallo-hydrolase [Saprospiraceae bacterium]|nr:MBL fold metallo-hydrolase [Saprospiraceae bacterium]